MQIVSNPERVCLEHALEFWTGLLVYAKDHSDPYEGVARTRTASDRGRRSVAERREPRSDWPCLITSIARCLVGMSLLPAVITFAHRKPYVKADAT